MKTKLLNISGKIVSDTQSFIIKQNETLENLTLSSITLKDFQSTPWCDDGHDRIYLAVSGFGTIEMDQTVYSISPRDIIFVDKSKKYKINNCFDEQLYLICISNIKETPDD